jgi:ABC-type antimicrobial peptide transport system ATPase subunit
VRIPETGISRPGRLTGSPGALPCIRELPSGSRASNRPSTAATTCSQRPSLRRGQDNFNFMPDKIDSKIVREARLTRRKHLALTCS